MNTELYCSPVFFGLSDEPEFECIIDLVVKNAIKMRGHGLDAAFLSPIDYARESSDYCIVPNVAVSSWTPTDSIVLHFKEGLHTVKTLVVSLSSTSEVVLASILLSERFDLRPKFIPLVGSLEQMLKSADAALLVGNAALEQSDSHRNKLDLVEEWLDMTDLPYVHGFWCVRESTMSAGHVAALCHACERGLASLEAIAQAQSPNHSRIFPPDRLLQYLESFSFTLTDEEQESVMEFLKYAYYHGVVPDIADLNFYPDETEDDALHARPSLN